VGPGTKGSLRPGVYTDCTKQWAALSAASRHDTLLTCSLDRDMVAVVLVVWLWDWRSVVEIRGIDKFIQYGNASTTARHNEYILQPPRQSPTMNITCNTVAKVYHATTDEVRSVHCRDNTNGRQ